MNLPEWSSAWSPEERWPDIFRVAKRALGIHGGNGNAEDCPVCSQRQDLPYPWLCTEAAP